MSASSLPNPPRPVMTVQGPIPHQQLGITDAHNHVWIAPLPGVSEAVPVLDQYDLILQELLDRRAHADPSR